LKMGKNDGSAYVATTHENQIIGFIAGLIKRQSTDDLLECIPSKDGVILELFVKKKFRRRNVGTMPMAKIEDCFKEEGCTISRVEAFEPNIKAHNLYSKLGYADRIVDMIKKL